MKLVIVGGGTSGWMTASYLSKAFDDLDITLIESGTVGTIGVGEATFSTVKLFFDFLELHERDWMPHCSGSYKLAIRFQNWTKDGGHFYHPFQRYETSDGMTGAEWWLKLRNGEPVDYACFVTPHICDAMRSPRFLDGTVYDEKVQDYFDDGKPVPNASIARHEVQYPYAYHFNAAELARYLQGYATDRGVKRIVDDVVDVVLDEEGAIAGVQTKDNGLISADLFVDCTGFRGLLINKALNEPFTSFNDTLLNDSAVAIQVPRDIEKLGMRPYTTAHAHNAGWSWNIPLYGRDGTGYVYSSQFIDKDEAEREFREFLGPAAKDCTANHIRMRIGRSRNSWVKNCVAIGLSSGFVEPLESTGIFFIQHGIEELVNHFPRGTQIDPNMVRSYNQTINQCIDGVRQFLTIHYAGGKRDDTPYWRAATNVQLPEDLAERMRIFKARLPSDRNIFQPFHGFEAYSWSIMLLGLGYEPEGHLALLDHLDESRAREMFAQVQQKAKWLVKALPSQYEYLTHVRQEDRELAGV
jgi:flavin-dependent dehydrogenase